MANPPQPTNPDLTLDGENGMATFGKNGVPSLPINLNRNELFLNYSQFKAFLSTSVTLPTPDMSKLAITPEPSLSVPDYQRAIFPPTPPTRLSTASKVVLVVGGSCNLGKIISLFLADQGYTVIATSRNPSAYFGVNRNPLLSNVPLDVRVPNSVNNFFQKVIAPHGRLDILILCQGVHTNGPLPGLPADYFTNSLETKVYGTLRCITAALPYLRSNPDGRVLPFSSIEGCEMYATPMAGGYQVANHMISMMVDELNIDERMLHAYGYITNPITYVTIEPVIILSTIGLYDYMTDSSDPRYKFIVDANHTFDAAVQSNLAGSLLIEASRTSDIGQQIYDIISAPQPGLKYFIGDPSYNIGGVPIGSFVLATNKYSDFYLYENGVAYNIPPVYNAAAIETLRQGLLALYVPP
jgi:NAD(P)-dependent dehydrogenase (short-subunit alcohol dehydrogenase family)